MGTPWRMLFEEPPDLVVERGGRFGQDTLFNPGETPGVSVAGQGCPAAGPKKPFFKLLYRQRHDGIRLPDRITETWLQREGLAPGNEGRLLKSLKFVGLVDGSGQPAWNLWHLNQRVKSAPREFYLALLEKGYAPLEAELCEVPAWHTVIRWIRAHPNESEQMIQRRISFYQDLRLAAHTGVQGYDALIQAEKNADWKALLPPMPVGGPKLILLNPPTLPKVLLRPSAIAESESPAPDLQLTLHLAGDHPPFLKVVKGRVTRAG